MSLATSLQTKRRIFENVHKIIIFYKIGQSEAFYLQILETRQVCKMSKRNFVLTDFENLLLFFSTRVSNDM